MDFRDTPDEAAFRAEVRAWLAEHLTGEFAALGPGRRPGRRDRLGRPHRVGAAPRRRPLGRACRGPRSTAAAALDFAQQVIFNEEYARAERAGARLRSSARGCSRPTLIAVRHRGAEAPLPPEDPVGRGAVVPGVLRAQRRLRPRQRPDPRRARRRRVGDQRPEGVDDARAPRRLVLRRRAAPIPSRRRTRACRTSSCPMDQPGVEVRPLQPDDRHARSSTRCSSTTRAPRRTNVLGDGRRGLEGRDGDARLRARHRVPRRSSSRSSTSSRS